MRINPIQDRRYKWLMVIPMMKWSTLLRFKREFPATKGESAASYFERLSKWLEEKKNDRI